MKRALLVFFISFVCHAGNAQSFLDTTKRWHVMQCVGGGVADVCWTFAYRLQGDTVLGSHAYKLLQLSPDSNFVNWYLQGALRDSGQKVYYHNFSHEYLLYDFGANVGDTIEPISICSQSFLVVDSVDTVVFAGQARKRLFFDFSACANVFQWIEGIGSLNGLINYWDVYGLDIWDWWESLLCYQESDTLLWINPAYGTCYINNVGLEELAEEPLLLFYPNPVRDVATLEFRGGKDWTLTVLDFLGRQVFETAGIPEATFELPTHNLGPGVYFYKVRSGEKTFAGKFVVN